MKNAVFVLFTLLALSCAQAQDSYFGIRADVVGDLSPLSVVAPIVGIQLGTPVSDNVELRVSLLTVVIASVLQADVFYTQPLSDTLRGYGGVGGDLGQVAYGDAQTFSGVHATAGVEHRLESGTGLFGEVQPLYVLSAPEYAFGGDSDSGLGLFWKLNAGVNFHF